MQDEGIAAVFERIDYNYGEDETLRTQMQLFLNQMGYGSITWETWLNHEDYLGEVWGPAYTQYSSISARGDNAHNFDMQAVGILCYGQPPTEPTPMPGPSYCDAVDDGGGGGDLESWLPQILVAQGSCMEISGWTLDVSVLNLIPGIDDLEDVTLPGFQLCVNPIQFGNVHLFGVTVDLDVIAFAMAGLVIIRILLRS